MSEKTLSISIPTWNRANYLKELIEILVSEITGNALSDDVEIVISNNGSEDSTHEIILEFMSRYDFFSYNRNSTNIGGNPNVMKSMQLASGKFLIFLGDDDRPEIGGLKRVVDFLKSHPDTGVAVDSFNFSKNRNDSGMAIQLTLSDLIGKYYWNIGNAGVFIVRSEYVKQSLDAYGADFFNQCWSQTQFMILGLYKNPNHKIYIDNLNIISHSVHTELTIYTSYYLWRAGYYELFAAAKSLEGIIDYNILQQSYNYLKKNVFQFVIFNVLQSGIFVDNKELRIKTVKHILRHVKEFSFFEQMLFYFVAIVLSLPVFISKILGNIFIYFIKGRKGIQKKNDFVEKETAKARKAQEIKSISVRKLEFETENY